MKIIIDVGHPAHVHMFHYFASEMVKHGHKVLFTCRDKEFEKMLLDYYGFEYINFGRKHISIIGKMWDMIRFDIREFLTAMRFKPDYFVSHGSIIAAHGAWLSRTPHITLEDTFNMEQVRLYIPFTKTIITANYPNPLSGKKVLRYPGYKELMSLHPNRFIPDENVLKELGVLNEKGECKTANGTRYDKYVIVRFVAWHATHDRGHMGLTIQNKIKAIKEFSKYARVFISSESPLPPELEAYKLNIDPTHIHHAEAFASMIFGESSTMVAEGAVLGVPGIFLDNTGRLFTKQLEDDYQLCYNLSESEADQVKSIQLGIEILTDPNSCEIYQERRSRMLNDKIDVTGWLTWFIENYPLSVEETKNANEEFWKRFK